MTIEVLIATMHQKDRSLLEKMNIQSDVVVVNQCDMEGREEFFFRGHQIVWINSKERGLSRSRNLALRNASADICLLCDDDEIIRDGAIEAVREAFRTREAAIIRFQIRGIERPFKQYEVEPSDIKYMGAMKTSSVEIAFRRENVLAKGIWFNEHIGAGTKYPMGEENAFLFQCLRNHLKIVYEPVCIADLHVGDSTWFRGWDESYFVGRGAAFAAMSPRFSNLLMLQFAVRKHKLYGKELSFVKAYCAMQRGKREYLQLCAESI